MSTNRRKAIWLLPVVLITVFFLLRSCGIYPKKFNRHSGEFDPTSAGSYVPLDATAIAAFDLSQIFEDIEFNELSRSQAYLQKLQTYYQQSPIFTRIFQNPESAGINTADKAIFYLDVGNAKVETYTASVLSIKDKNLFSKMVSENWKGKISGEKWYKRINFKPTSLLAFNDHIAVFISTNQGFDPEKILEQVFKESEEKYFDKHEDFLAKYKAFKTDAAFWVDFDSYSRNQLHATGEEGEFKDYQLKGNYVYGEANFLSGKMEIEIHPSFNTLLENITKSIFATKNQNSPFAAFLPADRAPSFTGQFSLNFNGILNLLLKSPELKVQARDSMAAYGLMLEDFDNAFTGNSFMAAYPNDTTTKSSVVIGFELKDKNEFFKIIDIMQDLGKIYPERGGVYQMVNGGTIPFLPIYGNYPDMKQRMIIKGNAVYFSLDKDIVSAIELATGNDQNLNLYNALDGAQHFAVKGTEKFDRLKAYSEKFNVKEYQLSYKEGVLHLDLYLINQEKSSLKQVLNIQ